MNTTPIEKYNYMTTSYNDYSSFVITRSTVTFWYWITNLLCYFL